MSHPAHRPPVRPAILPVLLALATVLGAAVAVAWQRAPALRARAAAARAERAGPGARGPLRPARLLSRGVQVAASRPGAEVVVDGVYRGEAWVGGVPTPEAPAWVALRVGRGPRRVLLSWTSSHNHDYRAQRYGAPVDYRIETSADSRDGRDGAWRTEVEVRGNPVRSRAHALDFAGRRWVRLVVTRLAADVERWGLALDELDVHDLSLGGDDVWVFLGDSIGAGVFDRAPQHRPAFPDAVSRAHPGYQPAMIDAGFCRARTWEVAERIDEVLALNPDARVFAIVLGANDGDLPRFRAGLDRIVERVQAAGRIAVVARIPFQTRYGHDWVAEKNEVLDAVVAARGLVPGPDLYAWFRAHPERLADGLHPDAPGSVEMNRLWAEAVAPLYPAP